MRFLQHSALMGFVVVSWYWRSKGGAPFKEYTHRTRRYFTQSKYSKVRAILKYLAEADLRWERGPWSLFLKKLKWLGLTRAGPLCWTSVDSLLHLLQFLAPLHCLFLEHGCTETHFLKQNLWNNRLIFKRWKNSLQYVCKIDVYTSIILHTRSTNKMQGARKHNKASNNTTTIEDEGTLTLQF